MHRKHHSSGHNGRTVNTFNESNIRMQHRDYMRVKWAHASAKHAVVGGVSHQLVLAELEEEQQRGVMHETQKWRGR